MLDVGDGHQVYWERCGSPTGRPAVYLHGGPGSGCSVNQRRLFDPDVYDVVLFDQRGSGRSTPLASDPDANLSTNTTQHLISDMERLRDHLGIERWTLVGLSWGTTLAIAYAEQLAHRVASIFLGLVTTTSRREVEWLTEDMGRIFPREWDRFTGAVPASLRHLRPVDAYAEMVMDPDPQACDRAAREWCAWEDAHVSLVPGHTPNHRFEDPEFRLRFARLVTHYWSNAAFLEEDQLLRDAAVLDGIPGVAVNGRYDISGPLITAWRLCEQWTTCRLEVVDDAGHGGGAFGDALLAGIAEVATLGQS